MYGSSENRNRGVKKRNQSIGIKTAVMNSMFLLISASISFELDEEKSARADKVKELGVL